ncbi:MAG TPA: 2,3-bisphosphoglycerate-independent phosphoglycerate mutase [Candidatus Methylacidiphilales bacterium]|jgi:2,3-bisphosphoglycerate-independent phosphoglycerate mutase|nr:2,3-bisphosphoglycerate-independent phosphoglycerate mutase [Candidatus Methylacidiphilales bacterium]
MKPVALIIRDGWGISPKGAAAAKQEGNAPLLAKLPFHDHLYKTFPQSRLSASGEDVGLPARQMGNSEVGHLNLGAGRIVYQELTRINKAIADGTLATNAALKTFLANLKAKNGALHLWGLLSDGGVHSHIEHLYALVQVAKDAGIPPDKIFIHAFLDGRDTSPTGGANYLAALQARLKEIGAGKIATVVGRYYAMDRDNRWERVELAWKLIFLGEGTYTDDIAAAVKNEYALKKTDEFMPPFVCVKAPRPLIAEGDGILFFNFRGDRARQLSQVVLHDAFKGFARAYHPKISYLMMTQYDATFDAPAMFPPQSMDHLLGQVVAAAGKRQLRMAETEKYPHVTYFFNGGIETPNPGEDRDMVPSPKVATYDLQPEMSAIPLTDEVLRRLDTGVYDMLILNYANPDMVGHTGVVEAAIKAVETIDACLKRVVEKILAMGGACLITADHGNCEREINDDGTPNTAHTTNLVHFIYAGPDAGKAVLEDGILADVAPTLLYLLGIPKPEEMTGHSLVTFKK